MLYGWNQWKSLQHPRRGGATWIITPCNSTVVELISFLVTRHVNTLRPRQNRRHFADDTFKRIFLNENFRISIKISLKFVPKGPINNIPALVQIMAWRRPGDKPLSEPMMDNLPTHICVTWLQWVNWTNGTDTAWQLWMMPDYTKLGPNNQNRSHNT